MSESHSTETLANLVDAIYQATDDLEKAQRKFLCATGWSYSSTHPDFCWRWSKSFNGVNYSFSLREAVTFQQKAEPIEGLLP